MSPEFALWLVVAAESQDEDIEAKVVEEYSGRGMGGEATSAVVTNDVTELLLSAIWEATQDPEGVPMNKPQQLRTDDLGKDQVIY